MNLIRFFFGEDIFISYSRRDGTAYAAALANRLGRQSFSCFLDQWSSRPGAAIPPHVLRALRRATMLVLIGSQGAADSQSVEQEVRMFLGSKRAILPISIDGALERSSWFPLVTGSALSAEHESALQTGLPSDDVFSRIENSFDYLKRNQRVRRGFVIAAIALFILIGIAEWERRTAAQAILNADEKTRLAANMEEKANRSARQAQEQEAIAKKNLVEAKKQEAIANSNLEQAKQQELAAKQNAVAVKLELGLGNETKNRRAHLISDYLMASDSQQQENVVLGLVSSAFSENLIVQFDRRAVPMNEESQLLVKSFARWLKLKKSRVLIEGHAGRFCVIHDAHTHDVQIAPESLPLDKCEYYPSADYALPLSVRWAQELAKQLRQLGVTADSVLMVGYGVEKPLYEYPKGGSAREFNRVASLNNRLTISFR